jgi:hypothetical protein
MTYNVLALKTFLNWTPAEYLLAALAPVKECALASPKPFSIAVKANLSALLGEAITSKD